MAASKDVQTVLITGVNGFLGRNLRTALSRNRIHVIGYDLDMPLEYLDAGIKQADLIYHLAGVNRPEHVEDFEKGNAGSTEDLCGRMLAAKRAPKVILSSSIQAALDNAYGRSKKNAELHLCNFCDRTGAEGVIYRLKNLFGKWGRPNFNSVTATFCHNVARDLPLEISNPDTILDLTYVDDVVESFVSELAAPSIPGHRVAPPISSYQITLGQLAATITSFKASDDRLSCPNLAHPLNRRLYATYISHLDRDALDYQLVQRRDERGTLTEFMNSTTLGQIFVSRTRHGITRGNHYHDTKTEKFLVLEGDSIIRLRRADDDAILEYRVSGEDMRVIHIPPGYVHSIENVGCGDLLTVFWANEPFDPARPDTYAVPVKRGVMVAAEEHLR